VIDGEMKAEYDGVASIVADKTRRFAVVALQDDKTRVIVDGYESPAWDVLLQKRLVFHEDGVLEYLACRDQAIYRVRHLPVPTADNAASPWEPPEAARRVAEEPPEQPAAAAKATEPAGQKPLPPAESDETPEIIAKSGVTQIFERASGNKARPASARVQVPEGVSLRNARISGEGHNQDRVGYLRTMEVKINGKRVKVIPAIGQGQTKKFEMALPEGTLATGWNDVQAYIEWSNDEYDKGHWVSLTLILE
jgi:hypothetical protein